MKIAVLGTGTVGNAIGTKLTQLGHEVKMGSRTANNEKASAWATSLLRAEQNKYFLYRFASTENSNRRISISIF